MRIIGGEARGRRLFAPSGNDTRPTSDRTRESLFNILSFDLEDAWVLDLFAGTGALALEALSRGAAFACVSDKSSDAVKCIRRNAETVLGSNKDQRISIVSGDYKKAISAFKGRKFSIVFLDPPYIMTDVYNDALEKLIASDMLTSDVIIVMERLKDYSIAIPDALEIYDTRNYRDTEIDFAGWRKQI